MKNMQDFKSKVRLNFYPLSIQKFQFKVWRIKYKGNEGLGDSIDLYRNSLPFNQNLDERVEYWVSFKPVNHFEEFVCSENYNHKLTQHYLFYLLSQKLKLNFLENEYIIPGKKFRKVIYFVLKKHEEGYETIWLEPYYLNPAHKFGFLIDFKFRKHPHIPYSKDIQKLSLSLDSNLKSNRNFYIDKYQKIQDFLLKYKSKLFPLMSNGIQIDISNKMEDLTSNCLATKNYVFFNDALDKSQFKGLEKYGPLKKIDKDISLLFIYTKKDQYLLSDLLDALEGKLYTSTFKGLNAFFKLKIKEIKKIELNDLSKSELSHSIGEIKKIKNISDSLIIPILIGDKNDKEAYYFIKYRLLKENLPLQVVTRQLLGKRDSFKWSVSNIALQIFAKLGGWPWKVLPSNERAIIFGIGQAHEKMNDKIVKYYAYSVCTDSSGIYKKINVLGKSDNDENNYLRQLQKNIVKTIEEYIYEGFRKYVIHIPYKISKNELEKISSAVKQLTEKKNISDTEFVVMKINTNNKFFGYAYTNSLIPYESTFTRLSHNPPSYLIWFEGLQFHRESVYKRIGGPVYVEYYWTNKESMNEEDRIKYLQDVLNLSGANWRGFNAKNMPVSIYYCQLIANLIKNFPEGIENIDKIVNPWFL